MYMSWDSKTYLTWSLTATILGTVGAAIILFLRPVDGWAAPLSGAIVVVLAGAAVLALIGRSKKANETAIAQRELDAAQATISELQTELGAQTIEVEHNSLSDFAQELGTAHPISPKRLDKKLEQIGQAR